MGIYDGTLTTAIQKEFLFRIWLVELWLTISVEDEFY